MKHKIEELYGEIKERYDEITEEFEQLWPAGSRIKFMLNSRQKKPSSGVVLWHYSSRGQVGVKLDNSKTYNGVKRVYWKDIL